MKNILLSVLLLACASLGFAQALPSDKIQVQRNIAGGTQQFPTINVSDLAAGLVTKAPVVQAYGRSVAAIAAVTSLATYTLGVTDGSFDIAANVLVTTASTHAFTVTCAYTDEGGTARTLTLTFGLVAGGVTTTSVANATGAVPYMGVASRIRAKAATAITIATTGTFTSVVYNAEATIVQVQ